MSKAIARFFVLLCAMAEIREYAPRIARAAQASGPEDENAVLALALAPAEALHA